MNIIEGRPGPTNECGKKIPINLIGIVMGNIIKDEKNHTVKIIPSNVWSVASLQRKVTPSTISQLGTKCKIVG